MLLLRYNNTPFKFEWKQISTIKAENNLLYIYLKNGKYVVGYLIKEE